MIGYAEAEIFSVNALRLHVRAARMVEACPYTDHETGELIRCHELARAVGAVMRKNFDESIPCHRVVHSDGTIGNYNRGGQARKTELLREEGFLK